MIVTKCGGLNIALLTFSGKGLDRLLGARETIGFSWTKALSLPHDSTPLSIERYRHISPELPL